MDRFRLLFGLGLIAMILGSGVLMSFFLLHEQETIISAKDWTTLTETVHQLVDRENALPTEKKAKALISSSPLATTGSNLVHINTATLTELDALPGIGQVRAQALLDERTAHGPYRDLDDIDARVSKIPSSILQEISDKITFED